MRSGFLILTLALSVGAQAQEWVSVGAASRMAAPAASSNLTDSSSRATISSVPVHSSSSDNSDFVAELSMQLEQLQQEVSSLRGRLEEQDHQIERMREEQQSRYLDLDRRLSVLMTAQPNSSATYGPVPAATPPQGSEAAYQQAMNFVREKKYPEASDAFDQFIATYPKDSLAGNALYWSGEVWLVRGDLDKALQQFKKIVDGYSSHDKAADATYKMGVTLHRQGKTADAKKWLQKVIDTYTGKADSTVRLARSYLEKL